MASIIQRQTARDKRVLGGATGELKSPMLTARLPPLNALRSFEAAARHASFSRAADELGVTHGAVSKQIRVLEDDLGQQLFSRGVRQVKLTAAGRELLAEIAPALERIGAAAAALRRGPSQDAGEVRINTRPSFALRWLIPHLPQFVRAYPGIEPQITTSTLEPARLSPSAFDIAIRRATPGRGGSAWPDGMQPQAFLPEGALPVASPALLAERPVHRLEDLNRHVLLHTATRQKDWEDWLRLAGCSELHPAGALWFEHQQFTLQAAIDGMGVAIGLSVLAAADLAEGRLAQALPGGPYLRLAPYCYALSPHAPAIARHFARWLQQEGASARSNTTL
jgi:LysR family glycine cleavage system transcriptional activator